MKKVFGFNVALMLVMVFAAGQVLAQPYSTGDVFAGTANGRIRHYSAAGVFLENLDNGLGGFTTGMTFDKNGNLYGTTFSNNKVTKFTGPGTPHTFSVFSNTDAGGDCESMIRDTSGSLYVGQADGSRDILKLDPTTGAIVDRFDVPTGPRGTDWIDLAADQKTMFYTSEGTRIRRYDLVTRTALSDFNASPLPNPNAYGFRILPSGGVIVADFQNLVRLNSSGVAVQTYDAAGEDSWFAMNLDPDGTSFWSGGLSSNNFYKFDIATGAVLLGPIATGGPTLGGLAVFGEITVSACADNIPPAFGPPSPACGSTINATVGTPVNFTMSASDANTSNVVTLSVLGLPSGATFPIPTAANPVSSPFSWTPAAGDVGSHLVLFKAADNCTTVTCTLAISVTGGDLTPPTCVLTGILPGPPKQILIAVQDNGSGLASVVPVTLTNATLSVAPFTVGTTSAVLVTATKINQALGATIVLRSTDVAGNSTVCDPVYTTLTADIPQEFSLSANYPNPFNPTTTIHFNISKSFAGGIVTLKIYDLLGREVKTLINDPMQAGEFSVQWDGTRGDGQVVPSGTYLYRLNAGEFVSTKKMTLMK